MVQVESRERGGASAPVVARGREGSAREGRVGEEGGRVARVFISFLLFFGGGILFLFFIFLLVTSYELRLEKGSLS